MSAKKETVRETIKKTILDHNLIHKGEHIVIGLSGGPDSVCLFHVLDSLQAELEFSLYAVHINHKFRPGAAEEDQAYVSRLCESYGVPCFQFTYHCEAWAKEHGMSSEEAGRKLRYEGFVRAAHQIEKRHIPGEDWDCSGAKQSGSGGNGAVSYS